MRVQHYDVIIIGGGLAGLTAAIHLAQNGHRVLVFEKHKYPHHKVCGEYVSNEVLPYLKRLGVLVKAAGAVDIDSFSFSTVKGKRLDTQLPLGGIGISRYEFDYLFYRRALDVGVEFQFQSVTHVDFKNPVFEVLTERNETYTSIITIGAFGKRSGLDKDMDREFAKKKSSWLAVKAHYEYEDFPERSVALHNFRGGYGGLSKTETGAVNFCYLVSYASFQRERNIEEFNTNVVAKNPFLGEFLQKAIPLFEKPLTIAQISFHAKKAVENHLLMCGDSAGLIHPLCGNGMAMAIHSAKIASELVHDFLQSEHPSRVRFEKEYQRKWNRLFKRRLWAGRRLQSLLLNPSLSGLAFSAIIQQPRLLQKIIRNTHGKPIN